MKELWTKDEASYDGEFVQFSPSWSWPKPVQQPHPPVLYGGAAGPTTFRHVVEFCDGWMPIHNRRDILPAPARAARRWPRKPDATRRRSSSACSACRRSRRRWRATATPGSPGWSSGLPQGDEAAILATLDAAAKLVGAVA